MDDQARGNVAEIVRQEMLRLLGDRLGIREEEQALQLGPPEDDRPRALVCDPNGQSAGTIETALKQLGYQVEILGGLQDSFQALDQGYELVAIAHAFPEDPEGGKTLLRKLAGSSSERRRHTFVAFVSPKYKSLDGLPAFVLGADLVIASADLPRTLEILREGIRGKAHLYRAFERAQAQLGG